MRTDPRLPAEHGLARRLARRLLGVPGARAAVDRVLPPLAFVVHHARLVEETTLFALRELSGRRILARYRVRGTNATVFVRHGTSDVHILGEVFRIRFYEFPERVLSALHATPRPLNVVDLGAHVGLFGVWVLTRFPEAQILSIEADAANAAILERTVAANGHGRWLVVHGFASTQDGTVPFLAGQFAESQRAVPGGSDRAVDVRAHDVFPHLRAADLIKIDIEGAEWEILRDPRFRELRAQAIVLEYHPQGCPDRDPATAARRLLEEAGYEVQPIDNPPIGVGMAWAWRA